MKQHDSVARSTEGVVQETDWGRLNWKISADSMSGAEMTFGMCHIEPGHKNPLHSHPNCEEILFVISGRCEHKLGEQLLELGPGDAIRIPRNVRHWARCISGEPLVAAIIFSNGDRQTQNHEGDAAA